MATTLRSPRILLDRVGRRRRVAASVVVASALSLLAWPVLMGAFQPGKTLGFAALAVPLAALAVGTGWLASIVRRPGRRAGEQGAVTISDDEIVVERGADRARFPRSSVVGGFREGGAGGRVAAVLELQGEAFLEVAVQDEESAARVLRAAGADARAVAMRIGTDPSRGVVGCLLLPIVLLGFPWLLVFLATPLLLVAKGLSALPMGLESAIPAGLVLFATWMLLRRLIRPTVVVGSDGVRVHRPFHRRVFIPYDELAAARAGAQGLALERRGRPPIVLESSDAVEVRAATDRIHEAKAAARGDPLRAAALEQLDRRGRPLEAWREHLRALARPTAGYRQDGIDAEDLIRVVESAAAPPERRAAAAVALGAEPDPTLLRRVRIAAEGCADERLRIALEKAAEGELDEEAIEEAAKRQRVE